MIGLIVLVVMVGLASHTLYRQWRNRDLEYRE